MAERRQKIRGNTVELDQVIGLAGLLAVNSEKNNLRLFDGIVMGGYEILNADQIAELYTLPNRLSTTGVEIAGADHSLNEAIDSGWYYTTSGAVLESPEASAGTILVENLGNAYIIQTWTRANGTSAYRRIRDNAEVWGAWIRLIDLPYLTGNPAAKAYDASRLGGQLPAYYTAILDRLGYTPVNKAGDTATNLEITGSNNWNRAFAISGTAPSIYFKDTSATGVAAFFFGLNSGDLYLLQDADADGTYAGTVPLRLNLAAGDGIFQFHGQDVFHAGNLTAAKLNAIYGYTPVNKAASNVWGGTQTFAAAIVTDDRINVGGDGAFMYENGSPYGPVWAAWGSTSAYSAINARIEARAASYANGAVGAITFRRTSAAWIEDVNAAGDYLAPAGAVLTGIRGRGGGEITAVLRHYLQIYNPVDGWATISG